MNFTLSFVFEETTPEGSDGETNDLLQSKEYSVDVSIIDVTGQTNNVTETSTSEGNDSDATTTESITT